VAAIQGLRGVAGKTAATGPVAINQADYSVAPQKGDHIWTFITVSRGGSSGVPFAFGTTAELASNPLVPNVTGLGYNSPYLDWYDYVEMPNNFATSTGAQSGQLYYHPGIYFRVASGTSADNWSWIQIPQTGDNISCVSVCSVVLYGQSTTTLDTWFNNAGALTIGVQNTHRAFSGNGSLYDPTSWGTAYDVMASYAITATTQCQTNTYSIPQALWISASEMPPDGLAARPGANVLCMFTGEATFGTSVTYSGLSSSLQVLYDSGNGMVIAGEYCDSQATQGSRQLTWGTSRRSIAYHMNSWPLNNSKVNASPTSRVSANRTF